MSPDAIVRVTVLVSRDGTLFSVVFGLRKSDGPPSGYCDGESQLNFNLNQSKYL